MPSLNFATFMIICPASFFLGLVFSSFPYDYPLLWSSAPIPPSHIDNLETHLKLLHNAPNLVIRIMHIITAVGLAGLVIKLYKPTESNMLFDGGSLVLYMIAVVLYLTNITKGLRTVSAGMYGEGLKGMSQDRLDDVDTAGYEADSGTSVLGKEDTMKVMAASNTILALVLVGVLVMQIGQLYAERVEEKERLKFEANEKAKQEGGDSSSGGSKKGAGGRSTGADTSDGAPVTRNTSNKKKQ